MFNKLSSLTIAAVLGAGALAAPAVGGLQKSVALQPLSVVGNTGLNVAAGIGAINLQYSP